MPAKPKKRFINLYYDLVALRNFVARACFKHNKKSLVRTQNEERVRTKNVISIIHSMFHVRVTCALSYAYHTKETLQSAIHRNTEKTYKIKTTMYEKHLVKTYYLL